MDEVALSMGVVAFDGRVLELFGFAERGSRRLHISQIESIDVGGSTFSVNTVRRGEEIRMMLRLDDAERAALTRLADEVRRVTG